MLLLITVISFLITMFSLVYLGAGDFTPGSGAYNEKCSHYATSEYTGCLSWSQWSASLIAIVAGAAFFASCEHVVIWILAAKQIARGEICKRITSDTAGSSSAGGGNVDGNTPDNTIPTNSSKQWRLVFLGLWLLLLGSIVGSWVFLMKPFETYQVDSTGNTLDITLWTIDVLLQFLGGCVFAAAVPLFVAVSCIGCSIIPGGSAPAPQSPSRRQLNNVGGVSPEPLLTASSNALSCNKRDSSSGTNWKASIGTVVFLLICFTATTIGTPIWNFSANSYFKTVSPYSWFYLPVGGPLQCSLEEGGCTCGADSHLDCPWFTFKIYTDTVFYYSFLIAVTWFCAWFNMQPRAKLVWWRKRVTANLSTVELCAFGAVLTLIISWFCYWYFIYGRFRKVDVKHDCYIEGMDPTDTHENDLCNKIPDSKPTGTAELHILARTMGHMASISFSLLVLPICKESIVLQAMGTSWDRVIHWHRSLGTFAFFCVTLHMVLWWTKWSIEGTLARNLLPGVINTEYWLWVSPVWQHYENFSVMMAQVAWCFQAGALLIAWFKRRRFYRLFYILHQWGIVFLIVGLLHAWSFWYFSLPGLVLWWCDRVLRLVRAGQYCRLEHIQVCRVEGGKNSGAVAGGNEKVSVLTIDAPKIASKLQPTQHIYLLIPAISLKEWHPFTANVSPNGEVVLMCRALGKWTSRLNDVAMQGTGKQCLLMGPYGAGMNVTNRRNILLVAGGIGITPILSVLNELSALYKDASSDAVLGGGNSSANSNAGLQSCILVWIVRSIQMTKMPYIREYLSAAVTSIPGIKILVHLTGQEKFSDSEGGTFILQSGRPSFEKYIPNDADALVFTCGPTPMQDTVTQIAHARGIHDIHTETFEL